jgi:predicted nucleotidyltransferase
VFIYGSVAKKTNRASSDVDILIIWNKFLPNTQEIKNELKKKFRKNVDLVSMVYKGKLVLDESDSGGNETFLNNIFSECVSVIGDINDIKLSEYVGKV